MISGNPLVLDVQNITLDGCSLTEVLEEYILHLSALHIHTLTYTHTHTHTHTHVYIYIYVLVLSIQH